MKKLSFKQKQFQIKKSKDAIRRLQKKNKLKREKNQNFKSGSINKPATATIQPSLLVAPISLSVFENCEETLKYFNDVASCLKRLKINGKVFFDLSKVESVTVDAVMYLIAIIKNTKRLKSLGINCSGNIPTNETTKRIFESCGFYDFVKPMYKVSNSKKDNHINIKKGKEANPLLAGEICDFVHEHSNCTAIKTKSLYTMLMELMTNTIQHAYTNNTALYSNWYIYVEDMPNYISFIFLDTGEGIPNTIRTKGIYEKIINVFDLDDAYFISSALKGELRSETKLLYRGKGLPEIYNRVSDKYIREFSVVSGTGRCDVFDDGEIKEIKLNNSLSGTLLCWKFFKEGKDINYENNN